jgi:hypothetical protein
MESQVEVTEFKSFYLKLKILKSIGASDELMHEKILAQCAAQNIVQK